MPCGGDLGRQCLRRAAGGIHEAAAGDSCGSVLVL